MKQEEMFDSPRKLSRSGDPITSKEAAWFLYESGVLSEMKAKALVLLVENPGRTAAELEAIAGVSDGRYRKRLNDLRKSELACTEGVRKCAITRRRAQVWWPMNARQ